MRLVIFCTPDQILQKGYYRKDQHRSAGWVETRPVLIVLRLREVYHNIVCINLIVNLIMNCNNKNYFLQPVPLHGLPASKWVAKLLTALLVSSTCNPDWLRSCHSRNYTSEPGKSGWCQSQTLQHILITNAFQQVRTRTIIIHESVYLLCCCKSEQR